MPFIDTARNLLTHNKTPSLDPVEMSDLLHHLFATSEKIERIQAPEAVYRRNHGHPAALDVFLVCTLPLAEKAARRRAHRAFIQLSDCQLESMYDGAVVAAIAVFQCNFAVGLGSRAVSHG